MAQQPDRNAAVQQQQQPPSGGETVTVVCKLPHGLVLRVFDMVPTNEPVMGGGMREVKVAQERPERVEIRGNAHPQNMAPSVQLVGGYALTHNVSKEFWDRWLSQNAKADVVRNGLIFAHARPTNAEAEATEKAKVKSGLERLDPDNLPKGLEKADEMKKRRAA